LAAAELFSLSVINNWRRSASASAVAAQASGAIESDTPASRQELFPQPG
jgi:hypothetical protein